MYKVFINDNALNVQQVESGHTETPEILAPAKEHLKKIFESLNQGFVGEVNLEVAQPEKTFEEFSKLFTTIEAAGGIVVNPAGKVLFIKRLGKWDLPKGKVEENESIETAAAREVEEECGLEGVIVKEFLKHTFHTYILKGAPILKKTHWYIMLHKGDSDLVPQAEEDITHAEWIAPEDWKKVFENTYPSIKYLLDPNGMFG